MRSGLVCLLAVTGCNSIFGSHDVTNGSKDADLRPKDAAPYTMYVTGMNVDTTTNPDPTQVMATYPVVPGVKVMAGAFGKTLDAIDVNGDGSFTIPYDLAQGRYRLVYTPPDQVPVEIQEDPQAAHFVIPSLGRPDAVPAPANAVLSELTPTGGPMPQYFNLHVLSIGTFAARVPGAAQRLGSTTTWTTNANQVDAIVSMSRELYTPDSTKGDRIVVVDGSSGDPNTASGFSIGTMTGFDSTGAPDLTLTAWKDTSTTSIDALRWSLDTLSPSSPRNRVTAAATNSASIDLDDGSGNLGAFIYAGVVPSLQIPGFLESGRGWQVAPATRWAARGTGGVDVPVFLPMSQTVSTNPIRLIRAFDGTNLPAFPTAMYARYSMSWHWQVDASHMITFTEGLQSITPITANVATTTPLAFSVGIAYTAPQHMMLGGVDIWTPASSAKSVSAGGGTIDFTYAVDGPTDDCVATIYRLEGSSATPVHRFLSAVVPTTAPITIDASIFEPTHDYVIGVVCHQGLPGVKASSTQPGYDWSKVSYPFMESTLYSYPFRVQ
ncbi:MAG TPA: hypothetical protein VIV58_34645 [Kofleriaceae bacterium]